MIRSNCSVKFFLKKTAEKKGQGYPIYCRIIYQRKKTEFFIGEYLYESKWDVTLGKPKRDNRLDSYLTKIKDKILNIKNDLEYKNQPISSKKLKMMLSSNGQTQITLLRFFDEQIKKYSNLKEEYSDGTIKKYMVVRKKLVEYCEYKGKELNLETIDFKFLSDWDEYIITYPEKKNEQRSRNTANSYHRKLKKVLGEAVKFKYLEQNPYVHFPIRDKVIIKEALNEKELKELMNHDLGNNESLKKTRDIFVFTCFTGVRFKDSQGLAVSNLTKDDNGILWLTYTQGKVNRAVDFPLLSIPKSILENYTKERSITGKLLPRISNQKVNSYLKVIADLVGIDKVLTHHIARHTFATTILRENEIPKDVTKEWLGHSTGKDVTLLYAKLSRKLKLQIVEHLNETIKKLEYVKTGK